MADERLIDANALRAQFDDIPPFIGLTGGCVQQYLDKAPTVDAVEVVRCKDCQKCSHDTMFGTRWCNGHEVKPDDFCSYGERSEGE